MKRILVVAALTGAIALSGCISNNPYASHTTEGAVSGGIIGATLGALSRPHNAGRGALIGGAIGVVTGALIGASADQREAYYRHHLRHHAVFVERHGDRVVLIVPSDRLFAPGSADLRPRGERTLARIAADLREHDPSAVKVFGYADPEGSPDVAQARAEAVAGALEHNGVEAGRIVAEGRGTADPRGGRVEIVLQR